MSFFKKGKPKTTQKRKATFNGGKKSSSSKKDTFFLDSANKKSKKHDDEEIDSDEFDIEEPANQKKFKTFEENDEHQETAPEKKLRLAKKYLEEIEKEERTRLEENEEAVEQEVGHRIDKDYLDSIGKLRRKVADNLGGFISQDVRIVKHKLQKLPITCVTPSSDDKFIFTGSKTSTIVKWNLVGEPKPIGTIDLQKVGKKRAHPTSLALSHDFKYLAVSDETQSIYIFCPDTLRHLHTFNGHRDGVTGLVFRKDTHTLYSSSKDRSVRIWSLDEMAYVETLFGHTFPVTALDALLRERVVSSGGSDRSIRIWKVAEESQLLYRGHNGNIDHVKFVTDDNFISAADDGSLCSWSAMRKKPLCSLEHIHGVSESGEANWISAISVLANTDLAATGSCDGFIRLWKLGDNCKRITQILQIPVVGFINSLNFTSDGTMLIAGVGQEHRLGRWWRMKEAKNCVMIIPLLKN